jgi:rod shape-determining protein MreC
MKPIFYKGPSLVARIIFFVLLALLIWILDTRTEILKPLRQRMMTMSLPLQALTSFPGRLLEWGDNSLVSRETLQEENSALRAENRVLQQKLQKMATLIAENTHLTELLNSSHYLDDESVLISRLAAISPDPLRQEIVLDKGSDDGVTIGIAALDAYGVVGQVIEVSPHSSRVMLVTDTDSAVPVQIIRNGIRLVVEGTGQQDVLLLRHVAATTDIQREDVLVTSGLDGHYPAHYPVANIATIEGDSSQGFLTVRVTPVAQLDRSRHFLLVLGSPGENK